LYTISADGCPRDEQIASEIASRLPLRLLFTSVRFTSHIVSLK
jgi:hypothetical protein